MSEVDKPFEIPEHWNWARLSDFAEVNPRFQRDNLAEDTEVSFVPMKRVEELSGQMDPSETKPLGEVRKGYTYFENGDVLFAKITPCMENGKVAVARGLQNGVGFGSTEFHVIRHPDKTTQDWIFYYLIQEGFRRDAKRAMTGSAGQKRVPTRYIEETLIPLPPLPEQRRIVAKIEELFSNLDAGMGELSVAEQQLERYRLSVLQAAVEGRLTADWRRTHNPEPADQLLERILEERQTQWEKDYRAKYEAKGKDMPRYWKKRYKEAEEPKEDLQPQLPDGWCCASLQQVTVDKQTGLVRAIKDQTSKLEDGRAPYIRMQHYDLMGRWNKEDLTYVQVEEGDKEKYGLKAGDVLFNTRNSFKLVGKTAVWPEGKDGYVFNNNLLRLRFVRMVDPRWIALQMQSPAFQDQIRSSKSATTSICAIYQKDMWPQPISVPPLAEQKQIVAEVERLLSVADDASATTKQEQTRAERLRQSILKQAFSGKLVPHEAQHSTPEASPESAVREGGQIEMGL